jgi:hypothetical protein
VDRTAPTNYAPVQYNTTQYVSLTGGKLESSSAVLLDAMGNFHARMQSSGLACAVLFVCWTCFGTMMNQSSLMKRYYDYYNREGDALETAKMVATPPPPPRQQPDAVAIIETVGELGNHLQLLDAGLELQDWFAETFGISVGLMIHQSVGQLHKSQVAYKTMQRCFPLLAETFGYLEPSRDISWENNNTRATTAAKFPLEERVFGQNPFARQRMSKDDDLVFTRWPRNDTTTTNTTTTTSSSPLLPIVAHIPLKENPRKNPSPERIRKFFRFDTENCCPPRLPDANVTVLHIRGFSSELTATTAKVRGLYELDPHRTATRLLRHLQPGDAVWIVARFEKDMYPFEDALLLVANSTKGLNVSRVVSLDAMHDFCILQQAKQVAGIARSTFLTWALRLNTNLRRADVYSMYSKEGGGQKKKYPCREFTNDDRFVCHQFPTID